MRVLYQDCARELEDLKVGDYVYLGGVGRCQVNLIAPDHIMLISEAVIGNTNVWKVRRFMVWGQPDGCGGLRVMQRR
jgi:hypothetical protein